MLVLCDLMLRRVRMDYILASVFCISVMNIYFAFLLNIVILVSSLKKCQAVYMPKYKW